MTTRAGALATGITGGLSADSSKSATQASLAFAGSGSFALQAYIPARAIISFAEVEFTQSAAANTLFPRFNGIGNLSAYARLSGQIAVTYAGAGNISALATQGQAAAARFVGAGNLSADSSKSKTAAATLGGLGNLSVDSDLNLAAQIRFAGAGNVSAAGTIVKSGAATFAGIGNLTASVVQANVAAARFSGIGNISADASQVTGGQVQQASAIFGGSLPPFNLLLHMDGADASTTFTDATGRHAVTPNGDVQIDTAQSKFGGASVLFDGTGDYLTLDGSSDFAFGTSDFTIDLWVRPISIGSIQMLYDGNALGGGVVSQQIFIDTSGHLNYDVLNLNKISGTTPVTANIWNHIALARNGSSTKLFLNGTQEGSTYSDNNNYSVGANRPVIGANNNLGELLSGWIDEYRVIKGYAAWTSNFSPPTVAYSSSDITAGNLSSFAVLGQAYAVTLSGVGSVSIDASVIPASGVQYQIAATFAGAGNLRAYLAQGNVATVTLGGIGNLSADSRRFGQVSATLAGTGNLSAFASQQNAAAAIFGGIGNLNAFATITGAVNAWSGAATFAGAGAVSASATQNQRAAAFFTGAGNLNAYVSQSNIAAVTLSGLGNLSALTKITSQLSTIFAGTGNVSINAGSAQQVQARFFGIGNFTSFGTITGAVNVWSAEARFVASGNLSASTISAQQALTRFGGNGNLSIDNSKYKFASGTFAGSGSLSITYAIVKYGEARFDGSSDLSISIISRQQASAIFSGQGFMRSRIVGGRGPRLPTRTGIAGEPSDARSPQTQTLRRRKEIA